MCEETGIQGLKVNHSVRKAAITTLVHAGFLTSLVQQDSDHKTLVSIKKYSAVVNNMSVPQHHENNDLSRLENILQEIGNSESNNAIVNNMSATASVAFPKLQGLFTCATINGNIINFGEK